MKRWVVVLAGGVGSRFWPLSTPERPKQLLPLVGKDPLLVEQLKRFRPLVATKRTLVLTNASLARAVARAAPSLPKTNIIAEPRPAGTAAALAWAAHVIAQRDGRDATMISVHADWAIGDPAAFRATLVRAAETAERQHSLVTVGIVPTRPDPGFGYIEPGDVADAASGAKHVRRFVEKPDRERAAEMQRAGYLWNSGIFVWRVGDFLDEVQAHASDIGQALRRHGRSLKKFFGAVKPIAVDHAVMERSRKVMVLPGDFGWDDVGTWGALHRVRRRDASNNASNNASNARAFTLDATGNVVHSDGPSVVLYGVNDLVVVARDGLTLVTTIDRSSDLKKLVDALPPSLRRAE